MDSCSTFGSLGRSGRNVSVLSLKADPTSVASSLHRLETWTLCCTCSRWSSTPATRRCSGCSTSAGCASARRAGCGRATWHRATTPARSPSSARAARRAFAGAPHRQDCGQARRPVPCRVGALAPARPRQPRPRPRRPSAPGAGYGRTRQPGDDEPLRPRAAKRQQLALPAGLNVEGDQGSKS